jgi:acyl dehydratase
LDTNIATATKTNETGYYRVGNLLPGKYRALFAQSGFSPLEMNDIEITPAVETRLDVQLKVGAARQMVEVSARAGEIESAPTNSSTTLGSRLVDDIPLAGRDIQQLAFLIPGVNSVAGPPGTTFGFNSAYGSFPDSLHMQGSALEVNGGAGGTDAWYLDGNLNVTGQADNAAVNPSPDALEEFQAVTTDLAAEYGHTGGGVFNIVLKSGTNSLHGDLYDYLRNSFFNARNPFTSIDTLGQIIPQSVLHFNDAGGTLGGPVYIPHIYNGKNRTFFFFSYDKTILHLEGTQVLTVPTPLMRQGDFSEVPNITTYGIFNPYSSLGPDNNGVFARSAFGTPITPGGCSGSIVGGVAVNPTAATCNFATKLPATISTPSGAMPGLNPIALYYLNSMPLPNYVNPLSNCPMGESGPICSNYRGEVGNSDAIGNLSLKIDHQWSDKSKYFGEWLYNPVQYRFYRVPFTGPAYPGSSLGFGALVPTNTTNQVIGFGNTYMLSPTLINDFRANFTRQWMSGDSAALNPLMDTSATRQELAPLNIPTDAWYAVPIMYFSMPVGGSINMGPSPWTNVAQMGEAYTFSDNLTWVHGKHTLKTGLIFRLEHGSWAGGLPTQMYFNGTTSDNPATGLGGGGGLAEFLMGAVPSGTSSTGSQPTKYSAWHYWAGFVQDDFRATSNLTVSAGLRYDLYGYFKDRANPNGEFCTACQNPTTGLPGQVVYTPNTHPLFSANKTDFAPRLNFAWTPFHDNKKTVIRVGYDIVYSDIANAVNMPGEGDGLMPGWFYFSDWNSSYYPGQCASFTGTNCVAFPLTPSSTSRVTLATPPTVTGYPAQTRAPLLGTSLYLITKPTSRDPMVQFWNLEIERQLPSNFLLSVGYVGNHGTHMVGDSFRNANYVPTSEVVRLGDSGTSTSSLAPITNYYSGQTATALANIWGSNQLPLSILLSRFPAFGSISQLPSYDGNNAYEALNVRLQKHLSSGFTFLAAYTNSKQIAWPAIIQAAEFSSDALHTDISRGLGGRYSLVGIQEYQNIDNRKGDRGLATDDIPQMFNFASTYELPFGKGKAFLNQGRLLNGAIGGWQLSGTFNAERGIPIQVSGPCDQITCRPDLIGNPKAVPGGQKEADWINAAAFAPPFGTNQNFWANYNPTSPLAYQWGTAGSVLSTLRAPGFWNLDAALSKRFPLGENRYFQVRWEAFNALNHQNLGYPNTSYCLPPGPGGETDLVHIAGCQFGRITNIQNDPRAMEFALKFVF